MDFDTTDTQIEQSGDIGTQDASQEVGSQELPGNLSNQETQQVIHELEKLGKIKYKGEEWTPDALEKAILRQKDYTKKTQEIAQQRKEYEKVQTESKYYKNLYWDINRVKENPALASEFIKVYPQEFHTYLSEVLSSNQMRQAQSQGQQQSQQSYPNVDVNLLSRLQSLENNYQEQQIQARMENINTTLKSLGEKYPRVPEKYVLAKVHDATERGEKPTQQLFEKAFRDVQAEFEQYRKIDQKNAQKAQIEANKKGKDVAPGGGTPVKAPQKFRSFQDITKNALANLGKN